MLKAPKKSISLPQSKCPLIKTIDCIKQSLGAVEVDGSYSMPPQLLRTGCFQGLTLSMSLFPRRMRQSLTRTQIAWISLSLGFLSCYSVITSGSRGLIERYDQNTLSCRDLFICGIKMPAKWKYGLKGFLWNP